MNNIINLDEVTSTNEYLKLHYEHLPTDSYVLAKKQTHGKGRLQRTWQSEVGNMYLSILKKELDRTKVFSELMNISVSIIHLLKEYDINAYIKYPNDIIIGSKKICGILIETKGLDILDYLVSGIGVNINQSNFGDLSHKATSIFIETGKKVDVFSFVNKLIEKIKQEKDVYREYLIYSYVIGKKIIYQDVPYVVIGIEEDGGLKLTGTKELIVPLNEITLEELYE